MKLKTVPQGGYPPNKCAASRCSSTPAKIIPRGAEFPGARGHVPLCDAHCKKLAAEKADTGDKMGTVYSAVAAGGVAPPPGSTPAMLSVVPVENPEALARETKDAEAVLELIQEFHIETQADYDFADEALGDAKAQWKSLEARKKKATAPLLESLKEIRSWFKPPQTFYEQAERLLKAKIAEAHQRAREAQDAALAEAQAAFLHGETELVDHAVEAAAHAEVVQSPHVTLSPVWQWEIVNEAEIPRDFMIPNRMAIGAVVREFKGETQIPGIRVWQDERVIRRSA
jgi:hypothetical protein